MAITLDRPEVRGTAIYRSIKCPPATDMENARHCWFIDEEEARNAKENVEAVREKIEHAALDRTENSSCRNCAPIRLLQSDFRRSSLVMREEAGKGRAGPAAITNTLCEISLPRGFQVSLVPGFAPRNAIHAETWKRQSRPRVIPSGFSSSRLAVATLS